jgi:hypothetical protein
MSASLNDKLAAYFKARPGQWIDGKELATVAGGYAWRTRCSNLRKRGMTIENRVEWNGAFRVSLYRYVPAVSETEPRGHNSNAEWSLR